MENFIFVIGIGRLVGSVGHADLFRMWMFLTESNILRMSRIITVLVFLGAPYEKENFVNVLMND